MIFDKLAKYIHYHSLSDLLIELMQVNIMYQPESAVSQEDEDETKEEEKKVEPPKMSEEQAQMLKVIKEKKSMVVRELVTSLS